MLVHYLLILSPPDYIKTYVAACKAKLAKAIGPYTSEDSIPHFTVSAFSIDDENEEILLRTLEKAIKQEEEFTITINNFGNFFKSETVFLKIRENQRFAQMSCNIFYNSYLSEIPADDIFQVKKPHLTIGKNLEEDFETAIALFNAERYSQSFTATSLILLKNRAGVKSKLKEFPLSPKLYQQLTLF